MQDKTIRRKEIITTISVLAVIAVMVLLVSLTSNKKADATLSSSTTETTPKTSNVSKPSSSQSTAVASVTSYKDGTYMATGSYESPGGEESVTVSVTIGSGDVTASSVKSGANDDEAQAYQSQFINGYKKQVVGKPISSLKLGSVSGSSLTSRGFNAAISKIKQQAQA